MQDKIGFGAGPSGVLSPRNQSQSNQLYTRYYNDKEGYNDGGRDSSGSEIDGGRQKPTPDNPPPKPPKKPEPKENEKPEEKKNCSSLYSAWQNEKRYLEELRKRRKKDYDHMVKLGQDMSDEMDALIVVAGKFRIELVFEFFNPFGKIVIAVDLLTKGKSSKAIDIAETVVGGISDFYQQWSVYSNALSAAKYAADQLAALDKEIEEKAKDVSAKRESYQECHNKK